MRGKGEKRKSMRLELCREGFQNLQIRTLGAKPNMGFFMGFGPLNHDEPNMKNDMHDESYQMHPTTRSF